MLSLGLPLRVRWKGMSYTQGLIVVVLVACTARLVPNFILSHGADYDIESYQFVARDVLNGEDVYSDPLTQLRHPYLPMLMYWMAISDSISQATHLPYVQVVRLAMIVADVSIAGILYTGLLKSSSLQRAFASGIYYALNPITVFVCAYHGQLDAIPSLFTLLAILYLSRSSVVSGAWIGLGILSKSWPLLALPSILTNVQHWLGKLMVILMAIIIPLVGVFIYIGIFDNDLLSVIGSTAGYNRGVGVWGYTYLFRVVSIFVPRLEWLLQTSIVYGRYVTLIALALVWLFRARSEPLVRSITTVIIGFLALTHAFSIQYLSWVVPFAVFDRQEKWLSRYILAAFGYMFLVYFTLIFEPYITRLLPWPQADWFIIMPAGLPAWFVLVGWLRSRWTYPREIVSLDV